MVRGINMKNLEEVIDELQSKVDFSGAVMLLNGDGHAPFLRHENVPMSNFFKSSLYA